VNGIRVSGPTCLVDQIDIIGLWLGVIAWRGFIVQANTPPEVKTVLQRDFAADGGHWDAAVDA